MRTETSSSPQQAASTGSVIGQLIVRTATMVDTSNGPGSRPWKINAHDSSAIAIVTTPASIYQTLVQNTNLLASPTCSKLAASIEHQLLFALWGSTRDQSRVELNKSGIKTGRDADLRYTVDTSPDSNRQQGTPTLARLELSIIKALLENQRTIVQRAGKPQHTDLRSPRHYVKMKLASPDLTPARRSE